MTACVPHWQREGTGAFLAAYDRALADITDRQIAHKARSKAAGERIDRFLEGLSND